MVIGLVVDGDCSGEGAVKGCCGGDGLVLSAGLNNAFDSLVSPANTWLFHC